MSSPFSSLRFCVRRWLFARRYIGVWNADGVYLSNRQASRELRRLSWELYSARAAVRALADQVEFYKGRCCGGGAK